VRNAAAAFYVRHRLSAREPIPVDWRLRKCAAASVGSKAIACRKSIVRDYQGAITDRLNPRLIRCRRPLHLHSSAVEMSVIDVHGRALRPPDGADSMFRALRRFALYESRGRKRSMRAIQRALRISTRVGATSPAALSATASNAPSTGAEVANVPRRCPCRTGAKLTRRDRRRLTIACWQGIGRARPRPLAPIRLPHSRFHFARAESLPRSRR